MNNKEAIECFENYVYTCSDCGVIDECHKQDKMCLMVEAEALAIDSLNAEDNKK